MCAVGQDLEIHLGGTHLETQTKLIWEEFAALYKIGIRELTTLNRELFPLDWCSEEVIDVATPVSIQLGLGLG